VYGRRKGCWPRTTGWTVREGKKQTRGTRNCAGGAELKSRLTDYGVHGNRARGMPREGGENTLPLGHTARSSEKKRNP